MPPHSLSPPWSVVHIFLVQKIFFKKPKDPLMPVSKPANMLAELNRNTDLETKMTATQTTQKTTTTGRTVRLEWASGDEFGVIVTTRRDVREYICSPLPSSFGDAFKVRKITGTADVYITEISDEGSQCNCPAHRYATVDTCVHVGMLQALRTAGKI